MLGLADNLQISNPVAMSPCPIILKRAKEGEGGGRRAEVLDFKLVAFYTQFKPQIQHL